MIFMPQPLSSHDYKSLSIGFFVWLVCWLVGRLFLAGVGRGWVGNVGGVFDLGT